MNNITWSCFYKNLYTSQEIEQTTVDNYLKDFGPPTLTKKQKQNDSLGTFGNGGTKSDR